MCEHCDEDTERIRPVVDTLLVAEAALHRVHVRDTLGQHVVRLAGTILDAHQDDDGYMGADEVKTIVLEYALVVQRLLALQEMAGVSP